MAYREGDRLASHTVANGTNTDHIQQVAVVDSTGAATALAFLPAGTNRSANVATTSNILVAANANRRGLEITNIGANNIGINQFNATAAIGTAGTVTLLPGATMQVRTNQAVFAIAATATTAVTAVEW